MNIHHPSFRGLPFSRILCAAACLFPSMLLAHPGHYHPDETDEFDFLRVLFFHSHGTLDYLIAIVALSSLAVVCFHGRSSVRIAAVITAVGSFTLLPII